MTRSARSAILAIASLEGKARQMRTSRPVDQHRLRVLADVRTYPPTTRAGSEIALHDVLRRLVEAGHDVRVLGGAGAAAGAFDGVAVSTDQRRWSQEYQWADVVITQLEQRNRALFRAARRGRPLVVMLHLGGMDPKTTFGRFSLVVFAAEWLRRARPWPGPNMTLHIPVEPARYRTAPGDAITLVGLSEFKGAMVFYELARRFPERQFVGVRGSWGEQVVPAEIPPNVSILENTDDIRLVFARTRLLLMPSRFEVFPRTCREAAVSGIPTIGSDCDGIREAMGPTALYAAREDMDAWAQHVRELDDPSVYERLSNAARERVTQQHFDDEFEHFVGELTKIAVGARGR